MKEKNPKYSQNFITSSKHVNEILKYTNIVKTDHVIEIGSGKGHFTKKLAEMSNSVKAVEINEHLCHVTEKAVEPYDNVQVHHADVLKYRFPKDKEYKIFSNIPYNISTEIVKKIAFETDVKYSYLIVERGFAKRLLDMNRALGLLLMIEVNVRILRKVPRSYFHPMPSVDSVLIILERRSSMVKKKDFTKYQSFVYRWVKGEYHRLFTKNQLRQALKHAKVRDSSDISREQFISIFESYRLFN